MEIDLQLLRTAVSGMISHCTQYDRDNKLLDSLAKHRNTIDLMIKHETTGNIHQHPELIVTMEIRNPIITKDNQGLIIGIDQWCFIDGKWRHYSIQEGIHYCDGIKVYKPETEAQE